MNKNLQSPTKLTEFPPLQPEEKQQGVGQFISKLFKLNKSIPEVATNENTDNASQESLPTWAIDTASDSTNSQRDINNVYQLDPADGRNHVNVLKRISNLLALKTNAYADTELKQYWMPDSVSKQCYECTEKFTTFRRRHHCRVCGQIFCSQCCNQQIPGKIFGCMGDLRVCTYCCKIVLSYLQSSDVAAELSADLKILQENLQIKYGSSSNLSLAQNTLSPNSSVSDSIESGTLRRKISLAYQEEKFVSRRTSGDSYLTAEEKCRALQNSTSLRNLFEEMFKVNVGLPLQTHRYRLRTYTNCLLGTELVDWLICQQKANTRIQAAAICQALVDGGYIECLTEPYAFVDGYAIYKPGVVSSPEPIQTRNEFENPNPDEPSWIQYVPQESSTTDSDTEQSTTNHGRITSSSSYTLDLNVGASTVYLSKPPPSEAELHSPNSEPSPEQHKITWTETPVVRTSEQRENVPESGWHNASFLREENGEKAAYDLLSFAFKQHEESLLKQILSVKGLSLSWSEIVVPLIHEIVDAIRPDMNHDAQDININQFVHLKKVASGSRNETKLIRGIVFSKNVAHKHMSKSLENPKILLLQCPIVYQRTEGRFMSLEPVLMQEPEYLRHVTARIVALQPDIILVQRTVSRLAQDLLREQKLTLVFNVKEEVLERLAKCTQADLVTSIDAHIGPRPRLGTCKKFHIETFHLPNGCTKTLMFFEGLPLPHLGGTVLLRGAPKKELNKLKQAASLFLFACYNWRLEKSFLMDEFAQPPNSKDEFFDESKENSPTIPQIDMSNKIDRKNENDSRTFTKKITEEKHKNQDDKKNLTETVNDYSDPLHSYDTTEILTNKTLEIFAVAELPFSNHFRKALDDTILCISPYLVFLVPYLETDLGRKCKLRSFFPKEIYYSSQFNSTMKLKPNKDSETEEHCDNIILKSKMKPPHPFLTAKMRTTQENKLTNEIQGLLAHFRACGNSLEKKPILCAESKFKQDEEVERDLEKLDVLEPNNHQKLAVLFCSFSHESNNAPAFCVYPWVVHMEFYGENDIPLGCFLERYCFRSTYKCQSKTCDTPMLKHIRRFVHNLGCVSISLNSFVSEFAEESIVMWSSCGKCQSVSPVVPMSSDTWSFSFAKYLELRFHGNIYTRRGNPPCFHSLHHDHYQYFGYKNIVASFNYTSIKLWEISLPSPIIELDQDYAVQQTKMIEEIKSLAQKGHDIFSLICDKLSVLPTELDAVPNLKLLLTKEQQIFKQKIDEVQLKLTSPTLETIEIEFNDASKIQAAVWRISDYLVRIKRLITETVDVWNSRLSEIRKSNIDKKKEKILPELESPNTPESKPLLSDTSEHQTKIESSTAITKKIKSLDHTDVDSIENAQTSKLDTSFPESTDLDSVFKTQAEDWKPSASPKGHQRSHSDGTVLSQNDEIVDGKKEVDKKSVKTILSQLLPSSSALTSISPPFGVQEHHLLATGVNLPLTVYENEPSSIVAYALNSFEYKKKFDEITGKKINSAEQTPSPVHKRKSLNENRESGEYNTSVEKSTGLLSFLRTKDSKNDLGSPSLNSSTSELNSQTQDTTNDKQEDSKKNKIQQQNIEIQFEDSSCNFFCRIYYAERFASLRKTVLPIGEEAYIRSLSRAIPWDARGGKSGSTFSKTADDRFILKEIPKNEVQIFLVSAPQYFAYMERCYTTSQPTLLGKILGVYQIIFKNNNTNASQRTNLLVMENLFYKRTVKQKFDLKGSMRNRMVNPHNQDGEIVLLDENLLKMTCDSPIYILPHSKAVLNVAIQNDTKFLSTQSVMDYSLLVGLDFDNKELVLGIIDYIRTFTWDKKIETIVKKTGILGGQGKLPTIVSPEEYQQRFIQAMHTYFLEVPDPWVGLGKGLEY